MTADDSNSEKPFTPSLDIRAEFDKEMESFSKVFHSKMKDELQIIGRITRSHLVVEHFLIEHIQAFNPDLDLTGANLDFSKLLKLAENTKHNANLIAAVIKPLWALNDIRKDLVHRLGTKLDSHSSYPKVKGFVEKVFKGEDFADPLKVIDLFTVLAVVFIKTSKILKEKVDQAELARVRHEALAEVFGDLES